MFATESQRASLPKSQNHKSIKPVTSREDGPRSGTLWKGNHVTRLSLSEELNIAIKGAKHM